MRLHYLQHVPFEGPAAIKAWAESRGHQLDFSRLFEGGVIPPIDDIDGLIVMGGPMGVEDIDRLDWLKKELDYIEQFAKSGKPLFGICLGAQLIAHLYGAKVVKNTYAEIGWFPLTIDPGLTPNNSRFAQIIPNGLPVFHWHGDRFAIPRGAVSIASTEACINQGFIIDDVIVGLQFHLEATAPWAKRLIKHCSDELDGTRYVQSAEQMLEKPERFIALNQTMENLLDCWLESVN